MKKTIFLTVSLMLLTLSAAAQRVQSLRLHSADGTDVVLTLSRTLVITFDDNLLKATDGTQQATISVDGLQWSYEEGAADTSIDLPQLSDGKPVLQGNTLLFRQLPQGAVVTVSTLDGKQLFSRPADGQSVSVSLDALPRGVVIIRAGAYSMKFAKP